MIDFDTIEEELEIVLAETFDIIKSERTVLKDPELIESLHLTYLYYIPEVTYRLIKDVSDDVLNDLIELNIKNLSSVAFNEKTTREILADL